MLNVTQQEDLLFVYRFNLQLTASYIHTHIHRWDPQQTKGSTVDRVSIIEPLNHRLAGAGPLTPRAPVNQINQSNYKET